jgi:hypothetical protein
MAMELGCREEVTAHEIAGSVALYCKWTANSHLYALDAQALGAAR